MIKHLLNASILVFVSFVSGSLNAAEKQLVAVKTDLGTFVIELHAKEAPITVKNFLHYVDSKFYDGTIFHRVVPGFVVQGGGMTFDFIEKKTDAPIKNESNNGLGNNYKTVAMARQSNPDSATAQFYINLKNNDGLNATDTKPGYTVFGTIVAGMEVIEKIAEEPRGMYKAFPEAPNYAVRILSAVRTSSVAVDNTAFQKKTSSFKDAVVTVNETSQ